MHHLPITRDMWHDAVPTLLKLLRRVMHVYPDIFCCDVLRQDIRNVLFTIDLSYLDLTIRYLILYPQLMYLNMSDFTQPPAAGDTLCCTCVCANPDAHL